MILCASSASYSHVNRARNANQMARTCETIVDSVVKITKFYDYQTWLTHLFDKFTRCAKVCGLLSLDSVSHRCWPTGRANSDPIIRCRITMYSHISPRYFDFSYLFHKIIMIARSM